MRQLGNLNCLAIFSILLLINVSHCLDCWRCTSDAVNSKFCGATIDFSQLTDRWKRWSYKTCTDKPTNTDENIKNLIPKCKILLQLVDGKEVYLRSCDWEGANVPPDSCKFAKSDLSFVRTIECNTCVEDGCNDKFMVPSEQLDNNNDNNNNNNNNDNNNNNNNNNNNSAANNNNQAVFATISQAVLFVVLMLIMALVQ